MVVINGLPAQRRAAFVPVRDSFRYDRVRALPYGRIGLAQTRVIIVGGVLVLGERESAFQAIVNEDGLTRLADVVHWLTIEVSLFSVRRRQLGHLLQHAHLFHVLGDTWPALHVVALAAHPSSDLHFRVRLRRHTRLQTVSRPILLLPRRLHLVLRRNHSCLLHRFWQFVLILLILPSA